MSATNNDAFALFTRKLDRLASLNQADRDAIGSLSFEVTIAQPNHYLVRAGDRVGRCCILLSGYACRHKISGNGARQIVSFHMAGDILDLQHLLLPLADHNIQTISEARLAWVSATDMARLVKERPAIADALWRDTLIDASVYREWVLNIGRRSAEARIAHMLCEFVTRREDAGLGSPERIPLPMTDEQIADATGLTSIQVTRVLHQLRTDGVIDSDKRETRILDWTRMRRIADFDSNYLHAAA